MTDENVKEMLALQKSNSDQAAKITSLETKLAESEESHKAALANEKIRQSEISALGKEYKMPDLALDAIEKGVSKSDFALMMLDAKMASNEQGGNGEGGDNIELNADKEPRSLAELNANYEALKKTSNAKATEYFQKHYDKVISK